MKKSKSIVYKALLAFVFTFFFSPSANAGDLIRWLLSLIPTGQYGAVVVAESTGGGKVYVETSQDSSTTGADESVGAKSTTTPNTDVTFELKAIESGGYSFAGWDDSNPLSGAYESTDATYTITVKTSDRSATSDEPNAAEYHRWAYFTPIDYTLCLMPGDHGQGTQIDLDYNATYTSNLRDYLFTPDPGYQFKDWKVTVADGYWAPVGKTYTNTNIPLSAKYGSATLTAEWSQKPYNITYNPNGGHFSGSSSTASRTDTYYIETIVPARTPTRAGHTFSGWKVTSVEDEGNWVLNQIIPVGTSMSGKYGKVTLTALWDISYADITITVSGLDSNDSAIFTVSNGEGVLYTVALSGSNPSVTIKDLPTGVNYTVNATSSWSWAYGDPDPTGHTFGLGASGYTASFQYSKNTSAKKHDEKSNTNWKP